VVLIDRDGERDRERDGKRDGDKEMEIWRERERQKR